MYMFDAFASILNLRFTNPPTYHPLPDHITRTFISHSPDDSNSSNNNSINLEFLTCKPTTTAPSAQPDDAAPILFLHGGFGSASVWLPFMTYLHTSNPRTTTYAISYRGHGASTSIPYLRMVYGTTMHDMIDDIVTAIEHIRSLHGDTPPVLAAHSSSGGLISFLLSHPSSSCSDQPSKQQQQQRRRGRRGQIHTPGLILLDAVPHFGNLGVYANWARHDPWFPVRVSLHLFHPISPLSSWELVRDVFFGPRITEDGEGESRVREFMRWMPKYESLVWPLGMLGSVWGWVLGRARWVDVEKIVRRVDGWGEGRRSMGKKRRESDRICVLVGSHDVLADVGMCRRAVGEYRDAVRGLREGKKIDDLDQDWENDLDVNMNVDQEEIRGASIESRDGIRFVVVEGAGHHVQNDVQWEVAANAVSKFLKQL